MSETRWDYVQKSGYEEPAEYRCATCLSEGVESMDAAECDKCCARCGCSCSNELDATEETDEGFADRMWLENAKKSALW